MHSSSHTEQKTHFSYVDIEKQVISSEKFKQICFELNFPNNRNAVVNALLDLNLDGRFIIKIQAIQDLFGYLQDLIYQVRNNKITLLELYNQIYTKLFNDDNIKYLKIDLNKALEDRVITLSEHYYFIKMLEQLTKIKPKIKKLVGMDYQPKKSDELGVTLEDKILNIKGFKLFNHDSGIESYLKNLFNDFFIKEITGWKEYQEINDQLAEKELRKSMVLQYSDWTIHEINQDIDALRQLKKDAEDILPKDNKYYKLAINFLKIDAHNLKEYIRFLNKNDEMFPVSIQDKITQEIIQARLQTYIDQKNKFELNILLDPEIKESDSDSKSFFVRHYEYSCIKKEVDNFIYSQQYPLSHHELWTYISQVVGKNMELKNLYLLAFIQNLIETVYRRPSPIDQGILWINTIVEEMLCEKAFKAEAQREIVPIALRLLINITNPDKIFNKLAFLSKEYGFFKRMQNHDAISKELRTDILKTLFPPEDEEKKRIVPNDIKRNEIFRDLNHKELQYNDELQNIIPAYFKYSVKDKLLAQNLILRLVAVNFIKDKILTGKALMSKEISEEMTQLFTPLIFESRGCRASHITKTMARLDLPQAKYFIEKEPASEIGKNISTLFKSDNIKKIKGQLDHDEVTKKRKQ